MFRLWCSYFGSFLHFSATDASSFLDPEGSTWMPHDFLIYDGSN